MQILIILWEPNDKWHSLSMAEKQAYLLSLDDAVNEARGRGLMTLGWSRVDRTLPRAPAEGYVGVFAVSNAEQVHVLDAQIRQSEWYDYFDSVNISINPGGGANPLPSREYARLLELRLEDQEIQLPMEPG